MNEFLNINWSWRTARSNTENLEYYKFRLAEHNETDKFYTDINEIDPIHYSTNVNATKVAQTSFPVDPRTKLPVKRLVIDVRAPVAGLFNNFPTKSSFNRNEQTRFLQAIRRIHIPYELLTQAEKNCRDAYEKALPRINEENLKYNDFVRSYFLTHLLYRKRHIDTGFNLFVDNDWRRNVGKVLLAPNQFYQLQTALPLYSEVQQNQLRISVEYIKSLKQTGWVPRSKFAMSHHANSFLKQTQSHMAYLQDQKLKCQAASRSNLQDFLVNHPDVQIVVNLSTLILMCNHPESSGKAWSLPFYIVVKDDEKKVIVLGKQLPPLAQSTYERNMKAHKYAFRNTYLQFEHKSALCLDNNLNYGGIPELVDEKQPGIAKTVESKEYRVYPLEEYIRMVEKKFTSDAQYFSNTICNLFALQTASDNCLKMAVITHQDCRDKLNDDLVKINLSLKLEYQTEFGAEEMLLPELVREWFHQYFRPDSKTLRVRIDSQTANCLSHKYLELPAIEEELLRLYGFSPRDLLQQFHATMSIIANFPEGRYLLRHDLKNVDKLMVYQHIEQATSSSLSLHDLYKEVKFELPPLEHYEWIKIDRLHDTKGLREKCVVPGLFPHWGRKVQLIKDRIKVKAPPPDKPKKMTPQQRKRAKRTEKRRQQAKKLKKDTPKVEPGEALDPYELFNKKGEVDVEFLDRSPDKVMTTLETKSATKALVDGWCPIDVNAYKNDAGEVSDSKEITMSPNISGSSDEFFGFNVSNC